MSNYEMRETAKEWAVNVFKSLFFCVLTMATYFLNQLNGNLEKMNHRIEIGESFSISLDKRLSAIEVARQINSLKFEKAVDDIDSIKIRLTETVMRVQTLADYIVKKVPR